VNDNNNSNNNKNVLYVHCDTVDEDDDDDNNNNNVDNNTYYQCSKWKFKGAGILIKSEKRIYRQKKWKKINGYSIY
jgi:hypothetical protein